MFNRIRRNHKRIGELLIQRGVIDNFQLENVLRIQKRNNQEALSGDLMVSLGLAKEEDIICAINHQYFFPYLPLSNYDINLEAVNMVPRIIAERYCLIPLEIIQHSLTVAIANPLNSEAIQAVKTISGCNVQACISTSSEIKLAINRYY